MPSAISAFVPHPRLREVDRIAVASAPAETWGVVRATDLYQLSLIRALFHARLIPERLSARLHGKRVEPFAPSAQLDEVVAPGSGFHLLADLPGEEFVAGAIGKFWEASIPFVHVSPETFAPFAEPGFGKVAWSLQVHERIGGGSWVSVDLRVDATDDEAWRRFNPYWTLIGRFSRVIRRSLLSSIAKRLGAPTRDEDRVFTGDELISNARVSRTKSVTVEAPIDRVWPWLVQMGCRRAGWYSIDRLDNGGVPSADRIIPELQKISIGDIFPATPKGDDGFAVLRVDPERVLVLGSPNLVANTRTSTDGPQWGMGGAKYDSTWSFVLEPIGEDATRLVTRVRAAFEPSITMAIARPAILAVHEIMEHAQLRNIKRRVESSATS